ncbi:hypothetical protein TYRP_003534, partial [Tyrophagus putrescentiae]
FAINDDDVKVLEDEHLKVGGQCLSISAGVVDQSICGHLPGLFRATTLLKHSSTNKVGEGALLDAANDCTFGQARPSDGHVLQTETARVDQHLKVGRLVAEFRNGRQNWNGLVGIVDDPTHCFDNQFEVSEVLQFGQLVEYASHR